MSTVLLIVAFKTDQPNIKQHLHTILTQAAPTNQDTEPQVWAKPVEDLVADDHDALTALLGWDAVSRLRVGDVVASHLPRPLPGGDAGDPHRSLA